MPTEAGRGEGRAIASVRADVAMVGLLLGLQPLATDLYLPALPQLTRALSGTPESVQFTLSGMLLVFGFGQLFWGSLSDRIGRRPCLLLGLSLFSAASLACAFATTLSTLVTLRLVAGFGLASPIACGRATVRDLYSGVAAAQVFSAGYAVVGLLAACSVPLGSIMVRYAGWRATLAVIGAFGLVATAAVAFRFAETLAPSKGEERGKTPVRAVLGDVPFQCFTALSAASYMGLFTILATSSYVFMDKFGLPATTYGALMLAQALTYIGGARLCHWLVSRWPVGNVVMGGGALCLIGGGLSFALLGADSVSPWAFAFANVVYMLGHGINQPGSQALAVGRFSDKAGLAASINGLAMALAAFAMGLLIAGAGADMLTAMSTGLAASGLIAAVTAIGSGRLARAPILSNLRKNNDEPATC